MTISKINNIYTNQFDDNIVFILLYFKKKNEIQSS